MKRISAILAITVSLAACGSNNTKSDYDNNPPGNDVSGGTTPSITSGNTASRQGQEIPRDSVELASDSTGNLKMKDSMKK